MGVVANFIDRQVADPQQNEIGIGGFTALVRISDRYALTAEMPSTPVEDGSFVNDHIIRKPMTLSIEGDVSDVHLRGSPVIRQFQQAQAVIGDLSAKYAPARTQAQLQKISALANTAADAVRRIDSLIDSGQQILDYFGNEDTESKGLQEQFLDAMEALYNSGQVFAIDMPFRRHENMGITSFVAAYDNEINSTSFTLEVQQLRFADLQFVEITTPASGLNGQTTGEVDQGTQDGEPAEQSFVFAIFGD